MWAFNYLGGIPSKIQKSILKSVLKLFVGKFVDSDVLGVDDFTVFGDEISLCLSNIQLSQTKLERFSRNMYGLVAKSGSIGELKLSIKWKDLFSGALTINIDRVTLEISLDTAGNGMDESVFFDAFSEDDLESQLEEKLSEILLSDSEEYVYSADDNSVSNASTESESEIVKTILKTLIRDISVQATNFKARLQLSTDTCIDTSIGKIILSDDTEDLRSAEISSENLSRRIHFGKTVEIDQIDVLIRRGGKEWPLLEMRGGEEGLPCFDFSAKVYKDRWCEVEGWADRLVVYASPESVDIGMQLLSIFAKAPLERSEQTNYLLVFGYLKVEVGSMSLVVTDGNSKGLRLELVDSIINRFPRHPSGDSPTVLTSSQYRLVGVDGGAETVWCEGFGEDGGSCVKVTLSSDGLSGVIGDTLRFPFERETLDLIRTFRSTFDKYNSSTTDKSSVSDGEGKLGLSLSVSGLDLSLSRDMIPECDSARLQVRDLVITISPASHISSSSLTFSSVQLSVNNSYMEIEGGVLTRKYTMKPTSSPIVESPFDAVWTMVEEERILNVADSQQSRQFQESVQTEAEVFLNYSCRSVRMAFSASDLVALKKAGSNLKSGRSEQSRCLRALIGKVDLTLSLPTRTISLQLSDVRLFGCTSVGQWDRVMDARCDILSVSRDGHILAERILNLSLDGSLKSFTATAAKSGDVEQSACQISGMEFKLPVKIDLTEEKTLLKELSPKDVSLSTGKKRYVALNKCSFIPEFPPEWPRTFPSTCTAETIRLVIGADSKCFVTGASLLLARRRTDPTHPGIYDSTDTFWGERGYISICSADFLRLSLARSGEGRVSVVEVENGEVVVGVWEDSLHMARHYFSHLANMSRFKEGAPINTDTVVSKYEDEQTNVLQELMDGIEENFFTPPTQTIDHPTSTSYEEPCLVFGDVSAPVDAIRILSSSPLLSIDPDYLLSKAQPAKQTFPYSQPEGNVCIRMRGCTIRIRLSEGSAYDHVNDKCNGRRTSRDFSIVAGSPPVSTSSHWSIPIPVPSFSTASPGNKVELTLSHLEAQMDLQHQTISSLRLAVTNVQVRDEGRGSKWRQVLGRDGGRVEETVLADGSRFDRMLRVEVKTVGAGGDPEYRLKVRMLPLSVNLDQATLSLIRKFSSSSPPSLDDEPVLPPLDPPFLQHCDIGPIHLRLSYNPLSASSPATPFQLSGASLTLPTVTLRGIRGSTQFIDGIAEAWVPHVKETQLGEMVMGIRPVRTVVNLGTGVADLILLPLAEYAKAKKDGSGNDSVGGNVVRGLRKGAASLLHHTLLESTRLGSSMAIGSHLVLEQLDDIFDPTTTTRLDIQEPESLADGLRSAIHALAPLPAHAHHTIIAVPVQVYEREGVGGALKAVIRAVPVAVLKPAMGAAEALALALMGLETLLDRENHKTNK